MIYRPSSAHRWIRCAGNPRLSAISAACKRRVTPVEASEGIKKHAYLSARLKGESVKTDTETEELLKSLFDVIVEKRRAGAMLWSEVKFSKMFGDTEICGTPDVVLTTPKEALIIDLKWGEGRKVEALHNDQLELYGLLVYNNFPTVENVKLAIYQPRGQGEGYVEVDFQKDDADFFEDLVIEAIETATQHPNQYYTGPHCWGCAALDCGLGPICPAVLEMTLAATYATLKDEEPRAENLSSFALLDFEARVRDYFKRLGDSADSRLAAGDPIPGWQWASYEGQSKWANEDTVADELAEIFGTTQEFFVRTHEKPMTITEARKLLKTRKLDANSLDKLIIKPLRHRRRRDTGEFETEDPGFDSVE